jgi:hypothetical protein
MQKRQTQCNEFASYEKRYHKKFGHSDIYGFIADSAHFGFKVLRQISGILFHW